LVFGGLGGENPLVNDCLLVSWVRVWEAHVSGQELRTFFLKKQMDFHGIGLLFWYHSLSMLI